MMVVNPESPRSPRATTSQLPPQTAAQRRVEAQERRRRLGAAFSAAVTGYPRGATENVYALPARYSTSTARIDDPILARTYASVGELRAYLKNPAEAKEAAQQLAVVVGRLRPGQRRYLAQQMLAQVDPPERSVCGVCWETYDGEKAASIPCGHSFHQACIQTAFENASTCTCPVCKRDVTLGALLHDAEGAKEPGADPDALWKSLPTSQVPVDPGVRPLTPPLSDSAPSLAAIKENWRAKVNEAYDADRDSTTVVKDRAWQFDTSLRRLDYTVPKTLRDRASSIFDISRILRNAPWTEQVRRALAYLEQNRVSPSTPVRSEKGGMHEDDEDEQEDEHEDTPPKEEPNRRCPVCEVPLQVADTASPPCGHEVHMGCWTIWFDKNKHTRCPTCSREIGVYACMTGDLTDPKDVETVKELWLTSEEVYCQ